MRRHFHPRVVNLELLQRLGVVVDNHPLRPNHRHLPYLLGIQPAVVNKSTPVLAEIQVHHRHVLDAPRYVTAALAGYTLWQFIQQMQQNGNVMRRQVPSHIDVFWNSPRLSRRAAMYCTSPISPALMISFIRRTAGENKNVCPTINTRPCRSARLTNSAASASVRAIGFSMNTCFPAFKAALAIV